MMTDIIPKQNRLHGKDHKVIYIDPVCGMSTDDIISAAITALQSSRQIRKGLFQGRNSRK
jgi:hypothetical protein